MTATEIGHMEQPPDLVVANACLTAQTSEALSGGRKLSDGPDAYAEADLLPSLADEATTVLWHSVMWQYLPREEQREVAARVAELGEQTTESPPSRTPSSSRPDGRRTATTRCGRRSRPSPHRRRP